LKIVCDSSTIVALERINHLWLLEALAEEILIPHTVNKEINTKKDIDLPACFKVTEAKDKHFIKQNRENLHIGEVEAIALAKEVKADIVILDDKKARRLAEKEGLKVSGLLALIIMAKEKGIIKRVKPIVDDLKSQSFFVGKDLYDEILKLSGEIS
jgi:predicted nucleic acid-binding protein